MVIADALTALGSTLSECVNSLLFIKNKGGYVRVPGVMDTSTPAGALMVGILSAAKLPLVDSLH